jgi:hypothetical protein
MSGIKLTIVEIMLRSNALLVNVFVVPSGLDVAPTKMVMSHSMKVRRVYILSICVSTASTLFTRLSCGFT